MDQLNLKRYAGLIGLGLMYLWGCAIIVWVDWTQSEVLFVKVVGIGGLALASLSGIAVFFYVNGLESQLKKEKENNKLYKEQVKVWREQAELASSQIEMNVGGNKEHP